jgi:hypothetical protein
MSEAPDQKTFLALFLGSATDEGKTEMSATQRQEFMEKWMGWATKHQASIVDNGTPLGTNTRVRSSGATEERNQIVTYAVVRAVSTEVATEILVEHPHLSLGGANSIEIMERLPAPGQVREPSHQGPF